MKKHPSLAEPEPAVTDEDELAALQELEGEKMLTYKDMQKVAAGKPTKSEMALFEEEKADKAEEFMAVLPWLGAIVAPSKPPPHIPKEPNENYALEHVYGYRTYDCRQNLYFSNTGKVIYNVATLGICHDIPTNTQKFFGVGGGSKFSKKNPNIHDDDILCLAVSPDKTLVATGQVGARPYVLLWEADTCKFKAKIQLTGKNTRGIACIGWSSGGEYVAFVDKHNDHNVYVYDNTGKKIFEAKTGALEVFALCWSKAPKDMRFATCGKKHINFWIMPGGSCKKGVGHSAMTFSCVTFNDKGTCYAGGINGLIYSFTGNSVSAKIPAHKGLIHAVAYADGKLISGGADKKVVIWNPTLKPELSFIVPSVVRSIDMKDGNLLLGMRDGTISIYKGNTLVQELMKSHHDGEVWGLDITDKTVITSGDDNKVMLWDFLARKNLGSFTLNKVAGPKIKYGASSLTSYPDNQCARAVCVNPKTGDVAVATNAGEVQIRSLTALGASKKSLACGSRWIEFMSYSPNGEFLAVGTHDNAIYIFTTSTYALKGKLTAHKSSITGLDWSKDSTYIRSNCEAYELLFFNITSMKQDPSGASATKDMEWASQNTKLGWHVTGIFPKGVDGSHVNGCDRSEDGKLIASADDWGLVNIYRNPCREGSQAKSYKYIYHC